MRAVQLTFYLFLGQLYITRPDLHILCCCMYKGLRFGLPWFTDNLQLKTSGIASEVMLTKINMDASRSHWQLARIAHSISRMLGHRSSPPKPLPFYGVTLVLYWCILRSVRDSGYFPRALFYPTGGPTNNW